MIKLAYINYWKDPRNDNYFTEYLRYHFGPTKIVNPNDSPDILIASCMGNINSVKNIKCKLKIFFYGENLDRYPPYNDDTVLQETFNLIVGFKSTNKEKKQIRFPLWLIYYPYYDYQTNNNILNYIQNKYNQNIKKTKKFGCSLIARHDRGGQRKTIYDIVKKHTIIMCPGKFMNNTKTIGPNHEDKIKYISEGIFNICPENSCYENYFTEKIFQAFEGGTIPIYWAIDYPEVDILNKNKYIFCNFKNINNLDNQIISFLDNQAKNKDESIFVKNANIIIKEYYTTLKNEIKNNL